VASKLSYYEASPTPARADWTAAIPIAIAETGLGFGCDDKQTCSCENSNHARIQAQSKRRSAMWRPL